MLHLNHLDKAAGLKKSQQQVATLLEEGELKNCKKLMSSVKRSYLKTYFKKFFQDKTT